jgi:ABC-type Mn2+/Zn2+ transport system permease subunit
MAGLIVWRIYRVHYFTPDASHTLLPVIIVIVESGALYATSVLGLLVTFLIGSNAQYIMQDVITAIVVSFFFSLGKDTTQFAGLC